MDFKGFLMHPLVLTGAAGAVGYYIGPKYHKESGRLYGVIAGAGLGYLLSRWLAPKLASQPPAQLPQAQQEEEEENIFGDYIDIDAYDDVRPLRAPQAPPAAFRQPPPQQAAPPPPAVDDLSDLSEGWGNGLGSFSGALGGGTSDRELDEIMRVAEAKQRRGN